MAKVDTTAVILCGGRGERLRPFTDTLPKPLVPLRGRPILEHILRYLAAQGIKRLILCIGYRGEAIREFVSNLGENDWEVLCVDSGEASMTKRLLDARKHLSGSMLICYGDTLANVNIRRLRAEHERHSALATMSLYPFFSPFGIVNIDHNDRISSFSEKPRLPYWINIGYMYCELSALDLISSDLDMPGFLMGLAATGCLYGYRHEGRHLTINTEKERAYAEDEIANFFTLLDHQQRELPAIEEEQSGQAKSESADLFVFNEEVF